MSADKAQNRGNTDKVQNSTAATLLSLIKSYEDQINDIMGDLVKVKQSYAEEICFCKVGDKIQDRNSPPVIVSSIFYSYPGVGLRVFKLKKNGEKYANDSEIWDVSGTWNTWHVVR